MFIWRLYAIFLSWLTLKVYIQTGFYYTGLPHVFDYLDVAESVLEFMAFYGFVFRFQTFNQAFWKITAPLAFVWDVGLGLAEPGTWHLLVGSFILGAPMYVAVFLYAYRSKKLWQS